MLRSDRHKPPLGGAVTWRGAGAVAVRGQTAISGHQSPEWESLSRPSKDNRTDSENTPEKSAAGNRENAYWSIARDLVDASREDLGDIAFRALAVSGDTTLRREAVRERRGEPGTFRAKTVSGVMQSFLTWFLEQEDLVLDFGEFEQPVGSSYDKDAELEKYGRLCDFERGALRVAQNGGDELYTALTGLTASHENANGKPRCPADLLRQLVRDGWSQHTRQALWRALNQTHGDVQRISNADLEDPPKRWWEYVRIVEPHKDGQAHLHLAIVTNFQIDAETFRSAIAKHVENVPSASWSAHPINAEDRSKSCISVRKIDPESASEGDVVGNLASYLSSYLSQFGDDGEFVHMTERSPEAIMFAATSWATGTRKIAFSNGAQDLRRLGHSLRPEKLKSRDSSSESPQPVAVRNEATGDQYDIIEPGSTHLVRIEDQSHLDPEKHFVGGILEATQ